MGRETQFGYDAIGEQTTITDPMGHVQTTAFTADGQVAGVTDNLNHTTSYTYGHDGELLTTADALSQKTEKDIHLSRGIAWFSTLAPDMIDGRIGRTRRPLGGGVRGAQNRKKRQSPCGNVQKRRQRAVPRGRSFKVPILDCRP